MLNKSSLRYLLATNKKSNKKFSSVKNFSSLLMSNENNGLDLGTPSTSIDSGSRSTRSVSAPTSPYKTAITRKFHETNFQVSERKGNCMWKRTVQVIDKAIKLVKGGKIDDTTFGLNPVKREPFKSYEIFSCHLSWRSFLLHTIPSQLTEKILSPIRLFYHCVIQCYQMHSPHIWM